MCNLTDREIERLIKNTMKQERNGNQQSNDQPQKGFFNKTWAVIVFIGVILGIIASVITIKECTDRQKEEKRDEITKSKEKSVSEKKTTLNTPPTPKEQDNKIVSDAHVNKKRIEATGESGYQKNEKWAREAAEKDAYDKLLRYLNKTSSAYEIDNDTVYRVDGYGYKAKIVIFTYK